MLNFKTNSGLGKIVRFFGSKTFTAQKYNRTAFSENRIETLGIKLGEQKDYSKFIPYSSHIALFLKKGLVFISIIFAIKSMKPWMVIFLPSLRRK